MFDALNLPFPNSKQKTVAWSGFHGCADALALATAIQTQANFFVIITPDAHSAWQLEHEITFFLGNKQPILHFPDWETLPYDTFSPLPEIVSERLQTLDTLPTVKNGALIVAANTLMQRVTPLDFLAAQKFILNIGDSVSELTEKLLQRGYQAVSQVFSHGEFVLHSGAFDIFAMGNRVPIRAEISDGKIVSFRAFDVESQRAFSTEEKIESLTILPTQEFPTSEHEKVTLFDYLPKNAVLVTLPSLKTAIADFDNVVKTRFELQKAHSQRVVEPEKLFLSPETLEKAFKPFWQIDLVNLPPTPLQRGESHVHSVDSELKRNPLPPLEWGWGGGQLRQFVENFAGKILFVAESAGHRENLLQTLKRESIYPKVVANWETFLTSPHTHCITVASIDSGLLLKKPLLALITESQLSGEKAPQRLRRKASARQLETLVANLNELTIGAPVVHSEHGVGRYLGLQTLTIGGMEGEFSALRYANDDKLYVPVAALHVISRYAGMSEENAPLHKLGSDQWRKAKQKAIARIHDVAAELLEIHAKRAAHEHQAVPLFERIDEGEYLSFAQGFRFEETPDQARAIQDIINDFNQAKPMDRVICGDVGFGKTEVAMRAAFLAVQSGKQVAVLVPTTLLAGQHHSNFCDRFADFPIKIELMSRFVTPKQQKEIASELEKGTVDIVIGTHKLLSDNLKYNNLGLVIIDEEHRFGVKQKEQFKKLRAEIDLLTLTATPIPRTLNMAMSGLRDISIIASPPPNRHPIKTFINEWDDAQIREACLREMKRGGQVFFLHNDIQDMEKMADVLGRLIPEAKLEIAHGQMHGKELERIMLDFYHQRFQILLSTTIIESGIDIPSANTIIINRADKLGLAALHQLRGRVGRSHHRAYAYLVVPPKALMTADAIKRLDAIEAAGELGAGFMLSSHDMEIRGAGELLGEGQSGQIHEIGFTLYTELLERAVSALKSGKNPELDLPAGNGAEIDLQASALIPEDYLGDVHERLVLYKRIASAKTENDLQDLQIEMIDRFGLLPEPTKTLFSVALLKQKATNLGIKKIDVHSEGGRILFEAEPNIDLGALISLIQNQPQIYKLDGQDKLRFVQKFKDVEVKIEFVSALLGKIMT